MIMMMNTASGYETYGRNDSLCVGVATYHTPVVHDVAINHVRALAATQYISTTLLVFLQ